VAASYALDGRHVVGVGHGGGVEGREKTPQGHGDKEKFIFEESSVDLSSLEHLAARHGVPDVLVHCAGGASVSFSIENPAADFRKNVGTISEVLEFSRVHGASVKVIYLSSAAVYGAAEGGVPIKESAAARPVSPYGLHKRISEELCKFYANYWRIPAIVIRLFSVYGNGLKKQLLWDACNKLKEGRYFFDGTGEEKRDWLHVKDAVRLIRTSERCASEICPTVNAGSGTEYSVSDVLTRLGGMWTPASKPAFSGASRAGDPAYLVADTSVIKEWGFTPEVSLTEGLSSYLEWYKKEALL
jgi:UDP-glucose 4-epimerase